MKKRMTKGDEILTMLLDYSKGYRLIRRRLRGDMSPAYYETKESANISLNTFRVTLSRLKKLGLAKCKKSQWHITQKGRAYLQSKLWRFKPAKHTRERNMIVAFDIPEKKRKGRDWLRGELKFIGFKTLQRSVWFGPSPLPAEFVKALEASGVLKYVKFFKAAEYEII